LGCVVADGGGASKIVSIVMPAYNCGHFVREAIGSVVVQTYRHWELIIVDDCSTDDTAQIVEGVAKTDNRIIVVRLPQNSGAAVARNRALDMARGDYVAFLDGDDLWLSDKLARQVSFMANGGHDLTYTGYERMSEDGRILSVVAAPPSVNWQQLITHNSMACLTVMYDRKRFSHQRMPLIRKGQDFGLWLNLLAECNVAAGLDLPLARYRIRRGSVSSNKIRALLWTWELYRDHLNIPAPASLYYLACFALNGVMVRLRERFPFRVPLPVRRVVS
jgi:teichuronic acid biosynthesis glycosyltransferase TuaG